MQQKKVPMRKCIGCNESKTKKELVRIVRSPEGDISLDLTGKKSGRGAYICPDAECLKKAKGIGFIMNGARLVHKINKRPALAGLFLI